MDPATLAAAQGFLGTAKEFNPTSSAKSGDAFSGRSPVDVFGTFGDVIVKGGKDSILTTAIIVGGLIIVSTIFSRSKRKK